MPYAKPILLVEDDPTDALAIKRALRESHVVEALIHVPSADKALAHLQAPGNDRPALILLDLHMPGTDGIEFIEAIKNDPSLRDIPVVVLTASEEPRDVFDSFDLGIAGYMVKSPSYDGLVETIRTILSYWSLNYLPAHHAGYRR